MTAVSLHGPCKVFMCKLLGPYPKTTFATVVFKLFFQTGVNRFMVKMD